MHDGFGHHFGDRPLHQIIVMGRDLTGRKAKAEENRIL